MFFFFFFLNIKKKDFITFTCDIMYKEKSMVNTIFFQFAISNLNIFLQLQFLKNVFNFRY